MNQDKYKKKLYCERNPNSNSDNYKTQYQTIKKSKWNNPQTVIKHSFNKIQIGSKLKFCKKISFVTKVKL